MHRVDAVENSLGVRWELVEGIGSLLGWHKGVHKKKIETHRKIIGVAKKLAGNDGPRSNLRLPEEDYRLAARMPEAVGLAGVRF
ncbi:hypothetical protein B296_00004056 [Ensete ventricosum]|uniref:Uncharacterized protein n=1 Tax=Ensete ventricosum TaxID=4639 RepID=A0A426YS52_ENSVE|nr:hypothetical protein B296_00004056 [Ensete ventricosum]